ncbi:hypothetical protein BCR33DRAFT_718785 [Rhizoclosmatium globosum]|uniref:Secreted protein n=1 Tax=Rhizoclosmatium globosum TaxID=329046 RepID=A0A1Y2C3R1_9FUNG|nr:hypothetical protein BCR33DRAFT_718785 [Rhizoclosmatium globosum]|eukprot:ORY41631.1 hypothetical protein BCR33DRAFT_718785 [Rhizoclosmatium globosum]
MIPKSTHSPLSATALSILDFFAVAHAMGPCLAPHTEPKFYGIEEPDMEMMQSIELVSIRMLPPPRSAQPLYSTKRPILMPKHLSRSMRSTPEKQSISK